MPLLPTTKDWTIVVTSHLKPLLLPPPAISKSLTTATPNAPSWNTPSGPICFATAGADTRTTQVFINLGDNSHLDAKGFAQFGEVISGWKVVKKLHDGYGDQPDQAMIQLEGAKYLEREFPKLDSIRKAELEAK